MYRSVRNFLVSVSFLVCLPAVCWAQEADEIKIIPYSQIDPDIPHPAYSGAPVTLKGIIRNASCASYTVRWDTDRDGNFGDETSRNVSRNDSARAVFDIGRNFRIPDVNTDQKMNINVEVRCGNNEPKYATMKFYVYAFSPDNNPDNWTDEQLQIMTQVAIQESLWYIHRTMSGISGRGKTLEAQDNYEAATGLALWTFTINGHLPAYPPDSIDFPVREGFLDDNSLRWHNDPYAETTMRYTNFMAARGRQTGLASAADEENTCGYNVDGSDRFCNRIDDANSKGAWAGHSSGYYVYRMGVNLGGLATVLPALAGTPLQVGRGGGDGNNGINGRSWEWYTQQMVDLLGSHQIDLNCSKGGWLYQAYSSDGRCHHSDGSTSQWAYIGLESAEIAGGPYGVIVNNRHKYRIADNLINNQRGDGAAGYRSDSGRGDFKLTGGSVVGARWLGIHQFSSNDGSTAFRGQSGYTKGRLRDSYDTYVRHLNDNWNNQRSWGSHWQDSMWKYGDYKCGNGTGVYNRGRCGSTYAMYSLQKGFRTGQPELLEVGNHDWVREYNTYYVRAQDRNADTATGSYNVNGRVKDDYCEGHSVTCSYSGGRLAAPMGTLTMTPSIFNPKPVPIASVNPPETREGCAGGNNGRVTLEHGGSFHPNPESRIILYRWDVDSSNGLWWDGDDDPDFVTQPDLNGNFEETFIHTYQRPGNYTATLQVVDEGLQVASTTVSVRVLRADNVAPSVAPGGPYIIEVGQALQLDGSATDGNLACGDSVTTRWRFSNNGPFNDAQGERPTVPWNDLDELAVGQPIRIFVQATDEANEPSAIGETTLTIYPTDPIAEGSANPSPAACQQEVTFNGRASAHPNPQRSIARYEWNLDGSPGFDRENAEVTWTYDAFGSYPIVLRVTDDLGRSDVYNFNVDVNQGNRPPVARIADAEYVVLQGDSVTLDGRTSSDNDADCGDTINNYRWTYVRANGQEVELANGPDAANPTIAWNVIQATLQGPTDRDTGEPSNTVRLTVTDTFGATATATTRVQWFAATPIARVSQTPDPAMIGQNTGRSQVSLDGRGSTSPVPGMAIATYQWIFDEDQRPAENTNPAAEGATVDFVKFFDPVPGADTIPVVNVWLRVVDEDGRSSGWTRYQPNYDVPPTRPTADADPTDPPEEGYHILECEGFTLDGSQSDDPDDEDYVRHYRWDLDFNADNPNEQFEADFVREDDNDDQQEATIPVSADELVGLGIFDATAAGDCAGIGADEESRQFNIRLEVEDNFRQLNTDDASLTVYRRDPVAVASANPNPAACNVQVTFDGAECYHPHPDIRIQSWEWDLNGNGVYGEDSDAQGMQAQARFTEFTFGDERKNVNLRVTDSRGNQTVLPMQVQVNIGNRAPTPVAGGGLNDDGDVVGPYVIAVNANANGGYVASQVTAANGNGTVADSITLSAAGSRDPDQACGDSIQSIVWQVNHPQQGYIDVPNGNEETVALTWPQLVALGVTQPGDYDVRVTATDRFGETASATQRIQVVEGPTAIGEANPARTGCENNVTFSAAGSQANGPADQGFNIVSYEWDLDGQAGYESAGREVTRAAVGLPNAAAGGAISMTVGLRVTDARGRTGTTTVNVNIDSQSVPPVADAGGPYDTGRIGGGAFAPVILDGRGSTDPNQPCDSIVYYAWDIDLDGQYGPADNEPGGWASDGAATEAYVDDGWLIGTERTVRLIVCDANYVEGQSVLNNPACSDPDETDIRIGAEAPPSGEVISPRADGGSCFGAGNMTVRYRVSDPAGDRVLVTGFVGDEEVYSQRVDAPANGAEYEFTVNTDQLVPEGRHEIDLVLDDERGGATLVNSGGRLLFDRTAPVVTIGNRLSQDFCYNPNQVPTPDVTVDDVDNAPSIARETVEDGCGRTLVVRATDACGNEGEARRTYLVAQPVDLELTGAANGELVPQTQYTWAVVGRAECADGISASISRNGGASTDYAEGQVINQPGDYVLSVSVENCQGVARDISRNFAINRPPVAVPVPDGHPNRVPGELAYTIEEGGTLQLDCSA
ncbi:MAG: PKD domain-containing protein [Myxococcota bacterium]|nr:PKD domain-containing protein [Myxococcota bacterium]